MLLHHHIHHHAKKVVHHVKKHHKKYLFLGTAMAGVFAITKLMVLFATSFALFSASHSTSFANDLPLDTLSQDTGMVSQDTGADLPIVDISLSGDIVSTGDSIDTGALLYVLAAHAAAEFGTGSETTGDVNTGSIDSGTGVSNPTQTGNTQSGTGLVDTGTTYYDSLLANQVVYCHTGDLIMNTVLSGQIFGGITPFQWTLSGNCVLDNLSFQLYDHNHQWIEIIQLSGSNLGFSFDSHFLSTGWYATTGLNASGQIYTVTPGLYSGVSSNFWTGYKVKILNSAGEVLYRSSGFTLDNLHPTLTGVSFVSSGVITTGTVHFVFSGSELLSGVTLSLSSGTVISSTTSGLAYDYVLGGFGTGFSGLVNYTLSFSDLAGNVSSYLGTGSLMFSGSSFTGVTLTGLMLTGNTGALPLLEAMKLEFSKFAECKSQLTYKTLPLTVGNKKFTLEMPSFEKSEVRKLVSAFSYYVIKKLDSVHTLDQTELDAITKTYNNFLVVLKLMKDDDNSCKQNLGNYYMGLFKSTMEKYGITQL